MDTWLVLPHLHTSRLFRFLLTGVPFGCTLVTLSSCRVFLARTSSLCMLGINLFLACLSQHCAHRTCVVLDHCSESCGNPELCSICFLQSTHFVFTRWRVTGGAREASSRSGICDSSSSSNRFSSSSLNSKSGSPTSPSSSKSGTSASCVSAGTSATCAPAGTSATPWSWRGVTWSWRGPCQFVAEEEE